MPMLALFSGIISWNVFISPSLSLSFFRAPLQYGCCAFHIAPEFSETLFISFQSFSSFLFCIRDFYSSVFHLNLFVILPPVSCCWLLLRNLLFQLLYFASHVLKFEILYSFLSVCCKLSIFASSLFPVSCIIFTVVSLKSSS